MTKWKDAVGVVTISKTEIMVAKLAKAWKCRGPFDRMIEKKLDSKYMRRMEKDLKRQMRGDAKA